MTPTPEQQAIIEASPSGNLLINSLAGTAKTTTLQMIVNATPAQPTLYLAFNKRNADEAKAKFPGWCKCSTFNALSHGAISQGRRLTVDPKKVAGLLKAAIDSMPRNRRTEAYDNFAETLATVKAARIQGYIPPSIGKTGLVGPNEFFAGLDEEVDRTLVDRVLIDCIRASMAGSIDFDDQIYMAALFNGAFPKFPRIMVDEAQDLNPLNHVMIDHLMRGGAQLIAVGDPNQSIYGFRGAMTNGMDNLRLRFKSREMALSVSFRCPRAVVRYAQRWVPQFTWPDWAPEGSVVHAEAPPSAFEDGSVILCRYNAPLLRMAFALLRAGRAVHLPGFDVGPGLVRILRKLGPDSLPQAQVLSAIDQWANDRVISGKSEESTSDRAECLRIFALQGASLSEAIGYAEHVFRSTGPIILMSGHKAKGLEWDNVYHLDPWRIPSKWARTPEELQQEHNIGYVISTRAKQKLTLFSANGSGENS